jgi:hypothetical protein
MRHEPPPPPEARQRLVDRDAGQPGRPLRPPFELRQRPEGPHVGLLHDVLRLVVVVRDRAGDPVEALVVAAHQHLEQPDLAAPHPRHDLFVGQRREARARSRFSHGAFGHDGWSRKSNKGYRPS